MRTLRLGASPSTSAACRTAATWWWPAPSSAPSDPSSTRTRGPATSGAQTSDAPGGEGASFATFNYTYSENYTKLLKRSFLIGDLNFDKTILPNKSDVYL